MILDRKSHYNFDKLPFWNEVVSCHRHLEQVYLLKYIFIENITEPVIEHVWQYFEEWYVLNVNLWISSELPSAVLKPLAEWTFSKVFADLAVFME